MGTVAGHHRRGHSPIGGGRVHQRQPLAAGWAGMSLLDYFTNERMWLEANLKQVTTFPDVLFLPGFWAEYGMCTEPSAFGARCIWQEHEFPFAEKLPCNLDELAAIERPDPRKCGLPPFVLKRLQHCRAGIEGEGHAIGLPWPAVPGTSPPS